jgi:hypothetical protein
VVVVVVVEDVVTGTEEINLSQCNNTLLPDWCIMGIKTKEKYLVS